VDPSTAEIVVEARPFFGAGGRPAWVRALRGEKTPGDAWGADGFFAAEGTLVRLAQAAQTGLLSLDEAETDRWTRVADVDLALDLRIVGKKECGSDDVHVSWNRDSGWLSVLVLGATLEGDAKEEEEEEESKGGRGGVSAWIRRTATSIRRVWAKGE
jgi:hypothetical protein